MLTPNIRYNVKTVQTHWYSPLSLNDGQHDIVCCPFWGATTAVIKHSFGLMIKKHLSVVLISGPEVFVRLASRWNSLMMMMMIVSVLRAGGCRRFRKMLSFYSASALLAIQSAVLARGILSVCPSVLPSRSGIVSRRMKIRSCGFQHMVGQSL